MDIHDMEAICRVCLYDGPDYNNIFQLRLVESENNKNEDFVEDQTLTFGDVLQMITNIKISKDDGLPQRICTDCERRVLDAYLLRQETERSNQSLMDMREREAGSNAFNIIDDVIVVSSKTEENPEVEVYNVKTLNDSPHTTRYKASKQPAGADDDDEILLELMVNPENKQDPIDVDGEPEEEDAVSFLLSSKVKHNSEPKKKAPVKRAVQSKIHECSVCNKSFSRKSNLVDHLRLHANMRPFECDVCQASFVQSGNLKAHMRIHTKERPYECAVCGKSYNQSGALKVHIRIHTNERNYVCNTCGKAFTNASDRNKHARVHDESLQYGCDFCNKSFAQRVNWKLHMTKHHSAEIVAQEMEKSSKKISGRSPKVLVKKE